ncbi:MAG: hypothetical protein HZB38_12345 [Planctomycetes bacterium]|nr:hypothetical protein [Planctomycetota bacterium]
MRSILPAGVGLALTVVPLSLADAPQRAGSLESSTAAAALLERYPSLRQYQYEDRTRAFYGVPMTGGASAQEAIDAFWKDYADAFGVPGLQLITQSIHATDGDKFTVGMYQQRMAGLPVEYGIGRILVNNWIGRVTYAAGIFADAPPAGFEPITLPAEDAVAQTAALPEYRAFDLWGAPELVVYAGTPDEMGLAPGHFGPPVRTWKFSGGSSDPTNPASFTIFVDAANARLVATRNEIFHTDVSGTLRGNATPGVSPDIATNPPALLNIPDVRVTITGGGNAFCDRDGAFTIPNAGVDPVTLTTNVSSGKWVNVNNNAGAELTISQSVTPPGPANLVFNPTPSVPTTAQVNALIHVDLIHNFVTDRSTWTGIDNVIPANVNVAGTCNAYFDAGSMSINFFSAGGGCVNASYSSVVTHEYGHYIVNRLNLAQGAFGEGFSDCAAILLYDETQIARQFYTSGQPIRDYSPGIPEDPYPCAPSCGGESHCCGELLAGTWRDIREQMGAFQGEPAGFVYSQQLFVDWLQISTGGQGNNSAHAQTAIEVLTVDDDDGRLDNGTPNFAPLRTAFTAHLVPFPNLPPVIVDFPNGLPTVLLSDTPTTISMSLVPGSSTVTPGSPALYYRVGAGAFTTVPMPLVGENLFAADIPGEPCGTALNYYVGYSTPETGPVVYPPGSPDAAVPAIAADSTTDVLVDDFETNQGWTVTAGAYRGNWERGAPELTSAQPGGDHTPGTGTLCWITDRRAGTSAATYDVDLGTTTLTSPVIDLAAHPSARIAYWRWYSNSVPPYNNLDVFVVEITNDGTNWVNVETIGPTGPQTAGGWYYHSFGVSDFVTPSATVRIRFLAADLNIDSIIEAAIDDVRVFTASCGCPGDLDNNGVVDIADLAILLSNFGTPGGATAEMGDSDGDGDIDLQDLATMLNRFGSAC